MGNNTCAAFYQVSTQLPCLALYMGDLLYSFMALMTWSPDFLAELVALDDSITALFALPSEQLVRTPAPTKWSALQAIDHIMLTNREYFPEIARAIRDSRAANRHATEPFHYSWLGRQIVTLFEPPPKLRIPLPTRRIAPPVIPDFDTVRRAYEEHTVRFGEYIREAMTVDMRRTKVRSPFLIERWVPLNLGATIGALLAHGRRHVYQAQGAVNGSER